jgi:hypothetical protein
MDQRKLMDNANTITDMAKVRLLTETRSRVVGQNDSSLKDSSWRVNKARKLSDCIEACRSFLHENFRTFTITTRLRFSFSPASVGMVKEEADGKTLNLRCRVGLALHVAHLLSLFFLVSDALSTPQTSNTVYEIVSDMSTRQDALEEKLACLEDKLQGLQVSIGRRH